jgi:Zinc knuckle
MQIYTDSVLVFLEKLTGIGFNITDDWIASIILAGLNDEYKPFILGLEASGVDITSDLVITKLIDSQPKEEPNAALVASRYKKENNKGPRCYNCNKFGHISKNCKKTFQTTKLIITLKKAQKQRSTAKLIPLAIIFQTKCFLRTKKLMMTIGL